MDKSLQKAIELQKVGNIPGAIQVLEKAATKRKCSANGYYFLSILLESTHDLSGAVNAIDKAIKLDRKHPDYWFTKGNISLNQDQNEVAIEAFQNCVELNANHVQALVNLSLAYQRLGQFENSIQFASQAMRVSPTDKKAWLNYIGNLGHLREFEKGQLACQEALAVFGEDAEILHMTGNIFLAAGLSDDAFGFYERALAREPQSEKILTSLGDFIAQYRNGRDAIPYLEKALMINPKSLDAKFRLGNAYLKAGFPADAVKLLLEVVRENPQINDVWECLILSSLYLEDALENEIYDLHTSWAESIAQKWYPKTGQAPQLAPDLASGDRRWKVGFVSPDLRNHSVARFMTALLKYLPDQGFDITCYSDVKQQDSFSDKLAEIDGINWVYSYSLPDESLAEQIRVDQIDVLIDLAGHTGNNRLQVFARKPAAIQISWLGYPHTTGLKTMDFRLTDAIADPVGESDQYSTESLIRLSDGFHCYESPQNMPGLLPAPCLKNGYLTFGSFNNQAKTTLLTMERWAALLKALPDSRLILKNHQLGDERNRQHWRRIFHELGVDTTRIEMVGYSATLEEHYSVYERIDIGLDTFPYNGTTTTCEALWMGVPVLTILGNTQRSRTGASLLTHAKLQDWVAADASDFVSKASQWNEDRVALSELKQQLRQQVEKSAIGDAKAFATKFGNCLKGLVAQQQQ